MLIFAKSLSSSQQTLNKVFLYTVRITTVSIVGNAYLMAIFNKVEIGLYFDESDIPLIDNSMSTRYKQPSPHT